MATIHKQKIVSITSVAANATHRIQWNPPWDTVLGYFVFPVPPPASGAHGKRTGVVAITKVSCTFVRHNDKADEKFVLIDIKNLGTDATGFDLYESWID